MDPEVPKEEGPMQASAKSNKKSETGTKRCFWTIIAVSGAALVIAGAIAGAVMATSGTGGGDGSKDSGGKAATKAVVFEGVRATPYRVAWSASHS